MAGERVRWVHVALPGADADTATDNSNNARSLSVGSLKNAARMCDSNERPSGIDIGCMGDLERGGELNWHHEILSFGERVCYTQIQSATVCVKLSYDDYAGEERVALHQNCYIYWEMDVEIEERAGFEGTVDVGIVLLEPAPATAPSPTAPAEPSSWRVVKCVLTNAGELRRNRTAQRVTSPFKRRTRISVMLDSWHKTVTFFKDLVAVCTVRLSGHVFCATATSSMYRCSLQLKKYACVRSISLQALCCRALRRARPKAPNIFADTPVPKQVASVLTSQFPWIVGIIPPDETICGDINDDDDMYMLID